MSAETPTKIGETLQEQLRLFDIDILHENYSCTIDFGREMTEAYRHKLENYGFDITHEEHTIYTLEL